MSTRDSRLPVDRDRPLPSTWNVLPWVEHAKPGLVRVVNGAGQLIATIDPVTRQRRDVHGRLEATLSPQGWARPMHDTAGTIIAKRPRTYVPDYEAGLDRRDVDSRSGRESSKGGAITWPK
jgi:hypothetical protein